MRAQSAHMQPCSHQRALCGVTKGLHVKSYAGDGVGPVSGQKHYLTGYGGRTETVHGFYSTCSSQIFGTPKAMTAENIPDHRFGLVHRDVPGNKMVSDKGITDRTRKAHKTHSRYEETKPATTGKAGKAQETHSRYEKRGEVHNDFPTCKRKGKS